jgi:hypothetical protein
MPVCVAEAAMPMMVARSARLCDGGGGADHERADKRAEDGGASKTREEGRDSEHASGIGQPLA